MPMTPESHLSLRKCQRADPRWVGPVVVIELIELPWAGLEAASAVTATGTAATATTVAAAAGAASAATVAAVATTAAAVATATAAATAATIAATTAAATAATAITAATAAAAATTTTTAAILTRTSLVDRQVAAAEVLTVERVGRVVGRLPIGHFHESEPLGAVRVAVDDNLGRENLAELAEQFYQVVFGRVVRQISDI